MISKYKRVLLEVRHKYKEMEDQMHEKVLNDHQMDVLRKQVEDLQDRNNDMNIVVQNQRDKLNTIENIFIDKIAEIGRHFQKRI